MPQDRWTAVDRYFTDLLVQPDAALDAAMAASAAAGLPPIAVSAPHGKWLMILARLQQARAILEIGTLGGYSTIWLARGMAPGGRLVTLESNPIHADVARANLARAGLTEVVEIRVGPAEQTLEQLAAERAGPFDLVFIDADKASYSIYLDWAVKLGRVGTVIVADNVVRDGQVIDASNEDTSVRGVRRFNELIAARTDVVATAIQTVGTKGYDGFVIALVTD